PIPGDSFSDPDAGDTLSYSMFTSLGCCLSFDAFSQTVAGSAMSVGTYTITIVSTDDGVPHLSVSNSFTIVVAKRPVTVKANDVVRPFGVAEQPLSLTYYGLLGPESDIDTPPTVTTTATPSSPPGPYPITVSGGSDDIYEFVGWTNGTLTV